ncbi:hypothetical protein SAMN04489725_1404 [Alicyclobacillus hesperidum]|uniref:Uncharacterized protein n=1 Tax=Alicyclobacillus hesperidum TaxID=89784 RepID=A0A1H2YIJ4_9BACL|nr:hypothetical protein [Alicyclobacillus hesperidum]SDX04997.1 hypothetical protein SAMN04489725_1404 [Alicyclobacillus hesperidum]
MRQMLINIFRMVPIVCLSVVQIPSTILAAPTQDTDVPGIVIDNVPREAANVNYTTNASANVEFSSISLHGSSVSLIGEVVDEGSYTPFQLTGNLYRGITSGRIDGVLTDQLNNYKVVRFELLQDPTHSILINKTLKGPVMALYLQKMGTNNLICVETIASNLFNPNDINDLFTNESNLPEAPLSASLWEEALFAPDKEIKTPGTWKEIDSFTSPSAVNSPQPNVVFHTYSYTTSYTDYYYVFGYNVYDTITIEDIASEPTTSAGDPTGTLKVLSTDFNESNGTDIKNRVTGFRIGLLDGGAGIKLTTTSPGGINQQFADAGVIMGGKTTFTIDLSYNMPYTPVNGSLVFSAPQQYTLSTGTSGNPQLYQNLNGAAVGSYFIPGNNNEYMCLPGDELEVGWQVGAFHGSDAYATCAISFIYDVYNSANPYAESTNAGDDSGMQVDPPAEWTIYY